MIYVLYVIGASLLPHHSLQLFRTACELAQSGKERQRFLWDDAEGVLSTKYASGCLGGVAGIIFTFTIESDQYAGKGSFIACHADLEREYDDDIPWFVIGRGANDPAANAMNN